MDSTNSWNPQNLNFRASSVISQNTQEKRIEQYFNDCSSFQSPQNNDKKLHRQILNPSVDSNLNPNSMNEISYNPFDPQHMRRYSQNVPNEDQNIYH